MAGFEQVEAIALKMTRAAEACDVESLKELWGPTFVLWYNTTLEVLSREQALERIAAVGQMNLGLKFENIERIFGENHYIQQYDMTGKIGNKKFNFRACIVVELTNGKVSRVNEWWDSARAPDTSQ